MNPFEKPQQFKDVLYGRGRNHLKTREQITTVVYPHVTAFRVDEKNTPKGKEFDTVLLMTLEHILTSRFKQRTKLTSKVTIIGKYV